MAKEARTGVAFAQKAAIGRSIVLIPIIALGALYLGLVRTMSALVLTIEKTVGAVYLVWLGVTLWCCAKTLQFGDLAGGETSLSRVFKTEALAAVSNPKAILIFAAFFSQFVAVEAFWQRTPNLKSARIDRAFVTMHQSRGISA